MNRALKYFLGIFVFISIVFFSYFFLSSVFYESDEDFCIQQIVTACLFDTPLCRSFPTPCDVPPLWKAK